MAIEFDKIIKNVRVVRPNKHGVDQLDIGIKDEKFARLAPELAADSAKEVVDAKGLLGFPGVADAHMHTGIYQPLADDIGPESKAAAMGGVTSSMNYIRTGAYYLNKTGPYREIYPEILDISKGKYHVDYCYHVAPIAASHIKEMEMLVSEHGVTSFKIFMFYGSYGLHGRSNTQKDFLMIGEDERYDVAHFEFIMRELSRIIRDKPALKDTLSLSLHCEIGEILNAYTKLVQSEGKLTGLSAYHHSRPPHSEGLAIWIASYLANETDLPNINLLHLTSRKAVESALTMQKVFPHISFKREVTIGHLLLDVDSKAGALAKVNPPIRPREDVERLWEAVLNRDVDWVVSDHACCSGEKKVDHDHPHDIFHAKSGFGGTEYLLPGLVSEGSKRGMSYNHMAELLSYNPAKRYGLLGKGDIAPGYDADLVLVDPNKTWTVRAEESPSGQGYTPFEGQELTAQVKQTYLRGHLIYDNGNVVSAPIGKYLRRPYAG
jgi:allantoinase